MLVTIYMYSFRLSTGEGIFYTRIGARWRCHWPLPLTSIIIYFEEKNCTVHTQSQRVYCVVCRGVCVYSSAPAAVLRTHELSRNAAGLGASVHHSDLAPPTMSAGAIHLESSLRHPPWQRVHHGGMRRTRPATLQTDVKVRISVG